MGNNKIPGIRFPGFNEYWEDRKLDEILKERKVKQKISEEAPLLAFAAGQGVIGRSERKTNNRDFLTKDSTKKTYLLTKLDDIVYNPSNLKYGAIDRNKHGQGVISPIYVTFETNQIPSFIELIVKSNAFKQRALQYEEGTVTKRQSVKPENLLSLNIVLPISKNEQIEIGDFFDELDDTIAIHEQELETLKQSKEGFLQKMFPQEGETVPEIRFPGFTNTWEQRKLREMLAEPVTDGPHETPKLEESGIPFISVDAIVDNQIDFDRKRGYISEETDELYSKKYRPQYHDVFLVKSGSTVGKTAIVETKERFNIWSPLAAMRVGEVSDPYFLYFLLQTRKMQNQVKDKASTGTQPNLGMRELEKFHTQITPNLEEQKKIGAFFQQLDNLITLHQQELEILKQTKKAFLQKMFV
ncbi:restriction endonuclease subunit S [Oceanobacillus rekensis]|uniref:restriction endonuclease subunit S n=1 Tax=Oceanobacillus rekensis TaxID=937927 RepID=UPI001FECBA68|nr:restriction endonuclease subunit S [Oceanobacillus rekensis]